MALTRGAEQGISTKHGLVMVNRCEASGRRLCVDARLYRGQTDIGLFSRTYLPSSKTQFAPLQPVRRRRAAGRAGRRTLLLSCPLPQPGDRVDQFPARADSCEGPRWRGQGLGDFDEVVYVREGAACALGFAPVDQLRGKEEYARTGSSPDEA